jgi:hypothetical protein
MGALGILLLCGQLGHAGQIELGWDAPSPLPTLQSGERVVYRVYERWDGRASINPEPIAQLESPVSSACLVYHPLGSDGEFCWQVTLAVLDATGGTVGESAPATLFADASRSALCLTNPQPQTVRRLQPRVVSTDSEQTGTFGGRATNANDGNTATLWHTWYVGTAPGHPHEILFDFESIVTLTQVRYTPRQDNAVNGTVVGYRLWMGATPQALTLVVDWTMQPWPATTIIDFAATSARYAKFQTLSSVGGAPTASAAEVAWYGQGACW